MAPLVEGYIASAALAPLSLPLPMVLCLVREVELRLAWIRNYTRTNLGLFLGPSGRTAGRNLRHWGCPADRFVTIIPQKIRVCIILLLLF